MRVQAFCTEPAVEGLDIDIVRWFSWAREVQSDVSLIGPEVHVARDKFALVVDSDRLGGANLTAYAIQRCGHIFTLVAEPCIQNRDIP